MKSGLRARIRRLRSAVGAVGDVLHLRREMQRLRREVEELRVRAARAQRLAAQAHATVRLDRAHADLLNGLPDVLAEERVARHVREAIARAPVCLDPFPHIVVERLFPKEVYRVLLKAIPPAEFFGDADPIKQNLRVPLDFGPLLSVRVLAWLDGVIAQQTICPAVVDRLAAPLDDLRIALFGRAAAERARHTPLHVSRGRLMLRRPGYHLAPHRDPKRIMLTCLLYFARPGDSDTYGTGLYRVLGDREAPYTQTYFPEEDGRRCELVTTVPYRPNSMLAFVNAGGAHGASIPPDAPASLERYAYQFYVGPDPETLDALVENLPPARRALWASKT